MNANQFNDKLQTLLLTAIKATNTPKSRLTIPMIIATLRAYADGLENIRKKVLDEKQAEKTAAKN